MTDAASIAGALRGRHCGDGRYLVRCPLPSHGGGKGDRKPSLSIRDGDTALLVHCFAGCDAGTVIDELRRQGLLDGRAEQDRPRRARPSTAPVPEPEPDPEALALWNAATPIGTDTLAARYLREHRGIAIDPPPSLRFLEEAPYPKTGLLLPALVAAVQRPDRTVIAVQVTFLQASDGTKAPVYVPRLTTGRLGTGAIRLAKATAVLGLAEGTETALSAMQLSGVPCWATLGGLRLGKISIPSAVREVHLFGDDDEPGRIAAEKAAERYTREGRKVVIRFPPAGHVDWNDYLKATAPAVRERKVA